MKIYTIEEDNYEELSNWVNKIVNCGKKIMEKLNDDSSVRSGFRNRDKYYNQEYDEDYDWAVKKVRGGRYDY